MAQGLLLSYVVLALVRSSLRYSFQCFACLSQLAALFHGKSEDTDYSPWAFRKMVPICLPACALRLGPSIPLRAAGFAKKLGDLSWWSLGDPGILKL